jgi:hypothetical protein
LGIFCGHPWCFAPEQGTVPFRTHPFSVLVLSAPTAAQENPFLDLWVFIDFFCALPFCLELRDWKRSTLFSPASCQPAAFFKEEHGAKDSLQRGAKQNCDLTSEHLSHGTVASMLWKISKQENEHKQATWLRAEDLNSNPAPWLTSFQ